MKIDISMLWSSRLLSKMSNIFDYPILDQIYQNSGMKIENPLYKTVCSIIGHTHGISIYYDTRGSRK
jgi:hypothetical protein